MKFVIGTTGDLFGLCCMNDDDLYDPKFIGDYGLEFCQPSDVLLLYNLTQGDEFPKSWMLMTEPLRNEDDDKCYYLKIIEYHEHHPYYGQRNIIATNTGEGHSRCGACFRVFRLKE